MSDLFIELEMWIGQVKSVTLEIRDLQENESVASASAIHTPPSGAALTITPTVATPHVSIVLGPFTVTGHHFVNVQAVGNAAAPSKPETVYEIRVRNG